MKPAKDWIIENPQFKGLDVSNLIKQIQNDTWKQGLRDSLLICKDRTTIALFKEKLAIENYNDITLIEIELSKTS